MFNKFTYLEKSAGIMVLAEVSMFHMQIVKPVKPREMVAQSHSVIRNNKTYSKILLFLEEWKNYGFGRS